MENRQDKLFHGAAMGAGQELGADAHSHLAPDGFVSMPYVRPGDAVFRHCDTAHMVGSEHQGREDASVLYIPSEPLCDVNTGCLKKRKGSFISAISPLDFLRGVGESERVGRGTVDHLIMEVYAQPLYSY
jgi:hypothetical protein